MPIRGRVVMEGIRFAAGVASNPYGVVTLWKNATGGKTLGCLPSTAIPELPHAVGLLPIPLESPEDISRFSGKIDAWLIGEDSSLVPALPAEAPRFEFPRLPPGSVEEALDRIEALAEWTGSVSGTPSSEGGLWKSIRAYATLRSLLDALGERCLRDESFLAPEETRVIRRAGIFLPPEAHSRLLSLLLGIDPRPAALQTGGEMGDPLIVLAKRLL